MLGLQNEREWKSFCETVIREPQLQTYERFSSNSRRVKNRDELSDLILGAFSPLSAAQVIERLEAAGIANASMNDMHAVWNHEQLAARGRWTKVQTPAGEIPALYPPGVDPSEEPLMGGVPALGQHSEPILRELGFNDSEIVVMRQIGAI
jgi:itaconate CoA-transferase